MGLFGQSTHKVEQTIAAQLSNKFHEQRYASVIPKPLLIRSGLLASNRHTQKEPMTITLGPEQRAQMPPVPEPLRQRLVRSEDLLIFERDEWCQFARAVILL